MRQLEHFAEQDCVKRSVAPLYLHFQSHVLLCDGLSQRKADFVAPQNTGKLQIVHLPKNLE